MVNDLEGVFLVAGEVEISFKSVLFAVDDPLCQPLKEWERLQGFCPCVLGVGGGHALE